MTNLNMHEIAKYCNRLSELESVDIAAEKTPAKMMPTKPRPEGRSFTMKLASARSLANSVVPCKEE